LKWEQSAVCLVRLDRRHDGAELIREELKHNPTPKMWCLLGDVTEELEHYHTALALSDQKHARAFKSLGIHYVQKNDFKTAIGFLEQSLECNSLQPGVWYTLACCAMGTCDWQVAMKACQTYVKLEPENAEAWSNLGVVFLNRKEKVRAYRAFSEAVRHSFHNWKMWENLLYTAVDIHAFSDGMRAIKHVLTNNPDKRVDLEALRIILSALITEKPDFNEAIPLEKNRAALRELLAFMTTKISTNHVIWEYYGDIYFFTSTDFTGREKGVRNYFRAVRQLMNMGGLESQHTVYCAAIKSVSKISKCFNEFVTSENLKVQADMAFEFSGVIRNVENFVDISKLFPDELDEASKTSLGDIAQNIAELKKGLSMFAAE
jgi:tetratricopeptide (TPR) repeat protein